MQTPEPDLRLLDTSPTLDEADWADPVPGPDDFVPEDAEEAAWLEERWQRHLVREAELKAEKAKANAPKLALLKAYRENDISAVAGIMGLTSTAQLRQAAPANDNAPGQKPPGRFDLTWFAEIDTTLVKRTFVKGVLAEGEFTMNSGLPGSGKSAIMTDIACHVAAGINWHGRRVKQGLVVYIAAERKKLTERRMAAFRKRHGVGDIPLLVLGGFIDMTSANVDTRALVATIAEAERQCGQKCIWVIIDTLTRVFGPGDQNASKDMGRFVANCDLMLKQTGSAAAI